MHARRCRAIHTRMQSNPSTRACARRWATDERRWSRRCACACANQGIRTCLDEQASIQTHISTDGHATLARAHAHAHMRMLPWHLHAHSYRYMFSSSGRAVVLRRRSRARARALMYKRARTHAGMHATGARIHPYMRAYIRGYICT
jgi:hypothetical protein